MFESKKWLILFFVLALLGSIGGSLVAFVIFQKKQQQTAAANQTRTVQPVETPRTAETVAQPEPVKPPVKEEPNTAHMADPSAKPDFTIVSRADWKAHPPVSAMKPHTPSLITIHHTATTPRPDKPIEGKLRNLQEFSQHENVMGSGERKPAWPDVPYHFYIDANGVVAQGRDINFVGDSATDYDATGHILIALEGNFENTEPTSKQMEVLGKMVNWLSRKYGISADKVSSHKAYVSTACPGKNLLSRMDEIKQFAGK